jgi:hypothetical protein
MTTRNRFVRWLTGEPEGENEVASGSAGWGSSAVRRPVRTQERPPVENNAVDYGVTIEEAKVESGAEYWHVSRVYHLGPHENKGRHHIFFDALSSDGSRIKASQARIQWEGGEHIVTLDKPENEPGANFPMWKWQVCSVHMVGLPSDIVHGLRTNHPDEPNPDGTQSGNTLFHHSFFIEFQKARAPEAAGMILGRVENSRDTLAVELLRSGSVVETMPVAADGTFTFANILPGLYEVRVEDQRQAVTVASGQKAQVVITMSPRNSVIEGTVQNAGGLLLRLVRDGTVLAEGKLGESGTFRLRNLGAGTYFLHVVQPGIVDPVTRSDALKMDGTNQRRADLYVAPPSDDDDGLDHYVLFGSADKATTLAQLTLLTPILAQKRLTFGFDRHEAAQARRVTVIGDSKSVSEFDLVYLSTRGVKIQRLTGTPQEISAQLRG